MIASITRLRITIGIVLLTFLLVACVGGMSGGSQPNTNDGDGSSSNNAQAPTAANSGTAQSGDANGFDYGTSSENAGGATTSGAPQANGGNPGAVNPATPTTSDPDAQRFVIVPDKSSATYHAKQKTFVPGISASANGTTHQVNGTIFFDPKTPSRSEIDKISVNVESLDSGTSLRDQRLHREFLESGKFPTAVFEATALSGLPTSPYTDGKELEFKITGNLTLHGVTKEVTFDAKAKVDDNTMTGDAKTSAKLTDFGIAVPDLLHFVKVQNDIGIEFSLVAQRS